MHHARSGEGDAESGWRPKPPLKEVGMSRRRVPWIGWPGRQPVAYRRIPRLVVALSFVLAFASSAAPASFADQQTQPAPDQAAANKPAPGPQAPIQEAAQTPKGGSSRGAAVPATGQGPRVIQQSELAQIVGDKGHVVPASVSSTLPAHGGTSGPSSVPTGAAANGRAMLLRRRRRVR
jgi:hypothetical protein